MNGQITKHVGAGLGANLAFKAAKLDQVGSLGEDALKCLPPGNCKLN